MHTTWLTILFVAVGFICALALGFAVLDGLRHLWGFLVNDPPPKRKRWLI